MVDLSANPDNLLPFLDLAASNQRANVARFPEPYQLIRRVNICLATAGKNLRFFADWCCEKGAPSGQLEVKTPLYLSCPSWATG